VAVPKRKMSKARTGRRKAQWKLEAPPIVECPRCHEPKAPHRACPSCGYYRTRQVIKTETD
jgi:large subunit ribosomal protein L32